MKKVFGFMFFLLIVVIIVIRCINYPPRRTVESQATETTKATEFVTAEEPTSPVKNQEVEKSQKDLEADVNMSTMNIGMDIHSSNQLYLASFYYQKGAKAYKRLYEAKNYLKDAQKATTEFLPEENWLNNQLAELISYYESTEEIIEKEGYIDEEKDADIIRDSNQLYLSLYYNSRSYSSLYNIRLYDISLKEDERWTLSELWPKFLFDDDCPTEITVDELYSMWADKYVNDTNGFMAEIEDLRLNDNSLDKEINLRWWNITTKFISIEKVTG